MIIICLPRPMPIGSVQVIGSLVHLVRSEQVHAFSIRAQASDWLTRAIFLGMQAMNGLPPIDIEPLAPLNRACLY